MNELWMTAVCGLIIAVIWLHQRLEKAESRLDTLESGLIEERVGAQKRAEWDLMVAEAKKRSEASGTE